MPKQIRKPKSEARFAFPADEGFSVFWQWSDQGSFGPLAFQEGAAGSERPAQDLRERTAQFGEAVVRLMKEVPRGVANTENNRLVDQLIGAATSIGASFRLHLEKNMQVSPKTDFRTPKWRRGVVAPGFQASDLVSVFGPRSSDFSSDLGIRASDFPYVLGAC